MQASDSKVANSSSTALAAQCALATSEAQGCEPAKTYNRFHDPEERSLEILKLRDLHATMDAAVLTA